MTADRPQTPPTLTPRQKIIAGILMLMVIVIIWQVYGLFRGSKPAPTKTVTTTTRMSSTAPAGAPMQAEPRPAALPKPAQMPLSPREAQLMQLQQETEARYVAALNELQMLKVSKDIAETNQAIAAAKLATITAQKNTLDVLTKGNVVAPGTYAQGLVNPAAGTPNAPPAQAVPPPPTTASYTVISVSQLQYKWTAVLGYQGNLFSVMVGDVLPPDGSRVIAIGKYGVTVERNGEKRKLSLVPVI